MILPSAPTLSSTVIMASRSPLETLSSCASIVTCRITGVLKRGSDGAGVREAERRRVEPSFKPGRSQGKQIQFVLVERSPADEGQSTDRSHHSPEVRERRDRVAESHHPEARIDTIDAAFGKREPQRIAFDEGDVAAPRGAAACGLQHQRRDVDSGDFPGGPHPVRELQDGLPGAAASCR